jgi:hypothetical protein
MSLFDAFASSAVARQNAELAQQVSRRSCAAVWYKVQDRAIDMSLAQARGYIHAHAAEIVEAEVARCGVSVERRLELAQLAREGVVETLVCELARLHRTQAGRRRAA